MAWCISLFKVKKGVVYKSIDGGKSWHEFPTGFVPNMRVTGIRIDHEHPNHVLIGTLAIPPNSGGGTVLGNQMGILETNDGEETWHTLEGLSQSYRGIHSFNASGNLAHLFVYTQHSNEDEKTFYSLDSGTTFSEVSRPVNVARFDPHDPTGMHLFGFSIYAQPNDFFESSDGGKTWNVRGKLPLEVDNNHRVSNIVWDPLDAATLYLNGGLGRVWKSRDKGATWELILSLSKLEKK